MQFKKALTENATLEKSTSAEMIQHSNYVLFIKIKALKTVATFRDLISQSFQRGVTTSYFQFGSVLL